MSRYLDEMLAVINEDGTVLARKVDPIEVKAVWSDFHLQWVIPVEGPLQGWLVIDDDVSEAISEK